MGSGRLEAARNLSLGEKNGDVPKKKVEEVGGVDILVAQKSLTITHLYS